MQVHYRDTVREKVSVRNPLLIRSLLVILGFGSVEKHFHEGSAEPQIPRLRSEAVTFSIFSCFCTPDQTKTPPNNFTGSGRVPHVRPSVRGLKTTGAAQQTFSLHRPTGS